MKFIDKNGTFVMECPENYSYMYLPLAGEKGLKSSITPNLGGDSKLDQNHFLLEPVSVENLHNNRSTRNFWCMVKGKGAWSVCGSSAEQEYKKFTEEQDESTLEAGFLWQKLTRTSKKYGLQAEVTSFIPVDKNMEVTLVKVKNVCEETLVVTPIAAIPIYGRSADNIRDHRHVTSLLHQIDVTDCGMEVTPTLSFDERGHQKNDYTYYACGFTGKGEKPQDFYPTVDQFLGEGGSYAAPEAVRVEKEGVVAGTKLKGKEVAGAMRFAEINIQLGEQVSFIMLAGMTQAPETVESQLIGFQTEEEVVKALEEVQKHWTEKVNVQFETGNAEVDQYLKWICFQPILRRIFGCSFLPYHDYGKGGRGWRDLWQDCLALLIMEPSVVRQMIIDNYGGVRIDGTNATIIGNHQGEFIADRNHITRVWMDHAFWPFVTTKLYIDQTGDIDIFTQKVPYFKDLQAKRGTDHDNDWNTSYGNQQRTDENAVYLGTVLEHILLQNLCAFYDVGDHNQMRLHGADWNDALDMAWDKGESVAFTCAYAGNLKDIAQYMRKFQEVSGTETIEIAEEMQCLLTGDKALYDNKEAKQQLLELYGTRCIHNISGATVEVSIEEICKNLEEKAEWLVNHIRENEWVKDNDGHGWFNGYYDNHGNQVEGIVNGTTRMMLTSQVFAIMSGTADKEQIASICESADHYLYEKKAGGYRLNTDFQEEKYDLGRMFGFAYGEKENGAVFSHMTVMYANALYQRGFAKEGYQALQTLLDTAMDFETSKMYPGLPEYFDASGRGMYSYLTGAASWYMLTMITEVFGVKGNMGDMKIAPALMPEQFNEQGNASMHLEFCGRKFEIQISNPEGKKFGEYKIQSAMCDGVKVETVSPETVCISKAQIEAMDMAACHKVNVVLG